MPSTDAAPPPAVALLAGAQTPAGSAIATSLTDAGWHVAPLDGDIADAAAVTDAYNNARAGGPVTLLVCAQEPEDTTPLPIEQTPLARLQRAVDVQLRGTQNACRAVLPEMLERGAGNIVAVVGADALTGRRTSDASAAAGSVLGLVRALAREVGPRGVQVNAIAAGTLGSTAHLPQDEQPPLGRGLAPEEVAGTVRWLASERHYFAGTVLSPAGGALL
jgi:2-hydroxycyclohexanecarboxyl-CoA dehydrogenase